MSPSSVAALALALGAAIALLGQAVSPWHLLIHETVQSVSAVGFVVAVFAGAAARKRGPAGWTALLGAVAATAAGMGFQAVHVGANAAVHGCRMAHTGTFLWTTWLPIALFGWAVGMATWQRGWRARVGVVLGLIALDAAHDGLQALVGVRIVDPLLGDPLAFDQRADMRVPVLHLTSRAWLLLAALTVFLEHARRTAALPRLVVATAAVPLALWTVVGSGSTGLGPSRGRLLAALDGELRTEGFVFRYASGGPVEGVLDRVAREAAHQRHELVGWLGYRGDAVVEVNLYDDTQALWEQTGIRNAHAGYRTMALPWWDAFDSTFPHELVHTLHAELSWRPELLVTPGLVEGTAMAWDQGFGRSADAHAEVAAALAAGHLPPASVFMSPLGFTKVNEGHAYRFAGSFMGFVVLEHGMPAFLELQRTLDWEAATGRTLDELDADWRVFLATLTVDPLEQARARDRFDPAAAPGVYDRRCPKLGSRVPAPETVARARLDHGDPLGAAELYATLPGDRWTQAAASALQRAGRHEEALAALATVATPSPDREQQVLQARINSLLALAVEDPGRWPDLYAAFARRRELEPPPQERQDIERLLAGPMREALGAALLASGEPGSLDVAADRFRALVEAWPDEPALLRLRARRGTVLPSRVWRRATLADRVRWREAVEVWEASGECPEPVDLERTVVAFLEEGDCALAERWQVLVGGACASDWRSGAVDARMAAARGSGVCH